MSNPVQKTHVVLGGGITGLALLWRLKKKYPDNHSFLLLEKSSRVGGWIQTQKQDDFLFEAGPRSCRSHGSGLATLQLVEELGLQDQVISAHPQANQRFLYLDNRLQPWPSSFLSLMTSSFTPKIFSSLIQDFCSPKGSLEDESVYDFFLRRIGSYATETFLDALTSGIYAGNTKELSIKSCYPVFHKWERHYGSLLKGVLFNPTKKEKNLSPFIKTIQSKGIFSFKNGMETLPKTLYQKMSEDIWLNREVLGFNFLDKGIEIQLNQGVKVFAENVYSTLPAYALATLIQAHHEETFDQLKDISTTSVAVVNLGYNSKVFSKQGFGYLIPSKEKENVLGVVWDSSVFPQQNNHMNETRLTVMIGGTRMIDFHDWSQSQFLAAALEAVFNQMQIKADPSAVNLHLATSSIPQYQVGHSAKINSIHHNLHKLSPHLKVLGSSFDGVSVNDCIQNAREYITGR